MGIPLKEEEVGKLKQEKPLVERRRRYAGRELSA